jgi:hypothetical protein
MIADTMNRFLLICQLLLILGSFAHAEGNVRIVDVGLNHLCLTNEEPCPIVVTLSNPFPQPQDFELQIGVRPKDEPGEPDPQRTYTHHLTLDALEERQIEALVHPAWYGDQTLEVKARIRAGALTGHDSQSFKAEWMMGSRWGIGIVCDDESVCKKVQSQIQLSGSPQDRDWKNEHLQLAVPLPQRSAWWSYGLLSTIVVAAPISHLNPMQRAALEWYARSGGSLVLLEGYLGDRNFLADYRRDAATRHGEVPIGAGRLYLAQAGKSLESVFGGVTLYALIGSREPYWRSPGPGRLQMQYATTFRFPHLGTLLMWLSIYILSAGLANFVLLRRWRRLEWGWVTVAGIALFFVSVFYAFGSFHRPHQVIVDNVAVHFLDTRSGQASTDYGLRISVPERQNVVLHTTPDALLVEKSRFKDGFGHSLPSIWLGREFTRGSYQDSPLGRDPLPQGEIVLTMPRWTSQDLYFRGTHSFPGTVHETSAGHLRNDTGQQFFDAVFVDSAQKGLWILGQVAPGAEIDLAQARYVARPDRDEKHPELPLPRDLSSNDSLLARLILERMYPPQPGEPNERRFYGLSAGPAQPVLPLASHELQREYALLVVIFQ